MDNGNKPANPHYYNVENGLTKREYFAALALQGLTANYLRENITGWDAKTYAVEAVLLADELLKQLEIK